MGAPVSAMKLLIPKSPMPKRGLSIPDGAKLSSKVSGRSHTNSHSLVPIHPFPQRDRHDAPWLADEPVPCMTAVINDIIVIAKHAIG